VRARVPAASREPRSPRQSVGRRWLSQRRCRPPSPGSRYNSTKTDANLLYWYKSTNTDANTAAALPFCPPLPSPTPAPHPPPPPPLLLSPSSSLKSALKTALKSAVSMGKTGVWPARLFPASIYIHTCLSVSVPVPVPVSVSVTVTVTVTVYVCMYVYTYVYTYIIHT